jgi:hypothetical protein
VVISSFTCVVLNRSVGVIGLYVLIAIVFVLKSPRDVQRRSPRFSGTSTAFRYSFFGRVQL